MYTLPPAAGLYPHQVDEARADQPLVLPPGLIPYTLYCILYTVHLIQLAPVGRWFSHPAAGRCALGDAVGDGGCTWQRAPLAHSISLGEQQKVESRM